jgi:hypothetical protein
MAWASADDIYVFGIVHDIDLAHRCFDAEFDLEASGVEADIHLAASGVDDDFHLEASGLDDDIHLEASSSLSFRSPHSALRTSGWCRSLCWV